jgi:DNA (cytosine-5)-methyltransferase 1
LNELALFAGAGGGILGGKLLGWSTVCAVECDPYAASVLVARQNDGILPPFPIWDDVRTFDGRPWRGIVDVVSGGFPCQDISAAGKGEGIDGARSGLWSEMARIVREVGPRFVFVENSPRLTSRGLGRVLGDLAELGHDAQWGVFGADDAGAPHLRKRIWIVADSQGLGGRPGLCQTGSLSNGHIPSDCGCSMADAGCIGLEGVSVACTSEPSGSHALTRRAPAGTRFETHADGGWWQSEPAVGRVAHGVAARVDRLKAIGNGQVPAVAALSWRILSNQITES